MNENRIWCSNGEVFCDLSNFSMWDKKGEKITMRTKKSETNYWMKQSGDDQEMTRCRTKLPVLWTLEKISLLTAMANKRGEKMPARVEGKNLELKCVRGSWIRLINFLMWFKIKFKNSNVYFKFTELFALFAFNKSFCIQNCQSSWRKVQNSSSTVAR